VTATGGTIAATPRLGGRSARVYGSLPALATALAVLVVWELAVRVFDIRPILLPPPSAIAATIVEDLPRLLSATWVTGRSALLGFAIGCGGGFLVGLAASRWRALREGLVPVGIVVGSMPIVATAPIFNLWFGALSIWSKVAVVALVVFFPTLINTIAGLASASPSSAELLRSYAAPERTVLRKLAIPSSLPFVFGALRVAAALSVIAAVVAEFFGGFRDSAGFFIKTLMANADYTGAWATVVALSLFGLLLYGAVALAERIAIPWEEGTSR
jgi:NitT/TauT family transport system permease protein